MIIKKTFIVSNKDISDPAVNLALEEFCCRSLDPRHNYLLFYINSPSVIIGAHQNPWEQIDAAFIKKKSITVNRRISGGGAVYHDEGNLNVCFISDHHGDNFGRFECLTHPIIHALNDLDIPVAYAYRNGIEIEEKKISGHAQFTNTKRMLSHGTLLFNANLDVLEKALNSDFTPLASKAIRSEKREVANITGFLKFSITMKRFMELLIDDMSAAYGNLEITELSSDAWSDIYQLADRKYRTWEWVYGHSPKFTIQETYRSANNHFGVFIYIERGLVRRIENENNHLRNEHLSTITNQLIGRRYQPDAVRRVFKP